nr:UDP-glycosyltransferase [Nicotiana tabacum]
MGAIILVPLTQRHYQRANNPRHKLARQTRSKLGSLSTEQIKELAIGLKIKESQQKFIWIVRDALLPEGEEIQIPKDYEEKLEGKGLLVKDWAPQLEILGHSSTGGFMSHCGWKYSCMENITMGSCH